MKKIKLQNNMIIPVLQMLIQVEWSTKGTRGYDKFVKRLKEKQEEHMEDITTIQKEYFVLTEDGSLLATDGILEYRKDITKEQKKEASDRVGAVSEEYFEIQFGEYSTKYETLFEELDSLEMKLKGSDAIAYSELMDAYEANEDKKEEEK